MKKVVLEKGPSYNVKVSIEGLGLQTNKFKSTIMGIIYTNNGKNNGHNVVCSWDFNYKKEILLLKFACVDDKLFDSVRQIESDIVNLFKLETKVDTHYNEEAVFLSKFINKNNILDIISDVNIKSISYDYLYKYPSRIGCKMKVKFKNNILGKSKMVLDGESATIVVKNSPISDVAYLIDTDEDTFRLIYNKFINMIEDDQEPLTRVKEKVLFNKN